MAKIADTNSAASVAGIKSIVDGVFHFERVETSEDLPLEVWSEIKKEFPTVKYLGEVPTERGTVTVGQPLPKSKWHISALAIARSFDGRPLTPFVPVVV